MGGWHFPFEDDATCDECGKKGAIDLTWGNYLCQECFSASCAEDHDDDHDHDEENE